jgi:hypothetical protein
VQAAGVGVVAAKALAIASICAVVRVEREPMPPRLPEMADWIWADVLFFMPLEARAPWQELQLLL